jgi:hypothetical protein
LPIRISTLATDHTCALLQFCLDCGCDYFEATAEDRNLLSSLIANLGPDLVHEDSPSRTRIKGTFDRRSADLLFKCFKTDLIPANSSESEADLHIRSRAKLFGNIFLETSRPERSILVRNPNDVQTEALYKLGLRFQVTPERPDLRPEGTWIEYGPSNLYVNAPPQISLDPRLFDSKRWIGGMETYGHDWYRCLENDFIRSWWTPHHDEAVRDAIREKGWAWSPPIDSLTSLAGTQTIEHWREQDWRCHRWAWTNILGNYARARANELRMTCGLFAPPEWLTCRICGQWFHQSRLWTKWLSREQAVICPVCFEEATWTKTPGRTGEQLLNYLRELAEAIEAVPNSDFGEAPDDYLGLTPEQVTKVVQLRKTRPSLGDVKQSFGSWFAALVFAGVVNSGAQKMNRGVRCLAQDGHVCLSLGEKTICDLLHRHGIKHEREVPYPGQVAFRADWVIGDTYIEYFGLAGNPEYDDRIRAKQSVAKEHGLKLVALYPQDVADRIRLRKKWVSRLAWNVKSRVTLPAGRTRRGLSRVELPLVTRPS